MSTVQSIDPATGQIVEKIEPTTPEQVAELCRVASDAAAGLEALGRSGRAVLLRAVSDELEARREEIVELGRRETALPEARLNGELTRTAYQARLFAEVLDDGGYLEAAVDHAGDTPMGPGPDLRRMLVPTGPVAVFGASNFPLAFSVPGGDTVSALAAGCPVVVKAHSSHPALSRLTYEALVAAAGRAGAPAGTVGIVYGTEAGAALVADPAITAVGFTGSLSGGNALMEIIGRREVPIPFFGELASLNPVVVTEGAAAARPAEIAEGLVTSVTGSGGQLCTKPGLVFVPAGDAGDAVVSTAVERVGGAAAAVLLNARISTSYDAIADELSAQPGVRVIAEGGQPGGDGFGVTPRLLEVDAEQLAAVGIGECFGPTTVLVRYRADDESATVRALAGLPPSLTGTVHSGPGETELVRRLTAALRPRAGRLLYDGWPTGVLVSWAQHHGGPWPSTNTQHTSVGTTAIRRWLRPVTWQNAPVDVLPEELRDETRSVPRRIDGRLELPV
ncbi:aldehyde dehydrogenase (NADP(+)) [Pseudonocardia nematodicida]|uniref:Aldehyde dehydrogenase (NADP(+)) n=1 Tax=Pseudonocardia nematodicida TaxID=1206997 RepID=A0ABV1KGB0_9PSEU